MRVLHVPKGEPGVPPCAPKTFDLAMPHMVIGTGLPQFRARKALNNHC